MSNVERYVNPSEEAKADANRTVTEQKLAREQQLPAFADPNAGMARLSGRVGGPFNIDGSGFGTSGMLVIGNHHIPTTRWSDNLIKGQLPADTPEEGEAVITLVNGHRIPVLYGKNKQPLHANPGVAVQGNAPAVTGLRSTQDLAPKPVDTGAAGAKAEPGGNKDDAKVIEGQKQPADVNKTDAGKPASGASSSAATQTSNSTPASPVQPTQNTNPDKK